MRNIFNRIWPVLLLAVLVVTSLRAEVVVENGQVKRGKFTLKDGTVISGEAIGPRHDGVSFRFDDGDKKGTYSSKYKWEQFSQETLKEWLQDNRVKQFVDALIVLDEKELTKLHEEAIPIRPPSPPLDLTPVANSAREFTGAGVFGALFSGSGLILLLAIYVANLFAAFEIAYFRNYHFAVVCGTGAVVPIVGPLVFLCLPTRKTLQEEEVAAAMSGDTSAVTGSVGAHHDAEMAAAAAAEAVPVYAEAAVQAVQIPATQVFKRGEVAINRRFIETKFAPFFRVVLGDTEKDLRIVVKASKGEFVGNRISKVTLSDMTLQITDDNGVSVEETFPISDIFELQIRHKEAPAQ